MSRPIVQESVTGDLSKLQKSLVATKLAAARQGGGYTGPAFATALPSSPTDGQEIYYQQTGAMAVAGQVWHLRYRSASGSAYKWEYVGGAPLHQTQAATVSTSSGSYANLGGPQATVPLAGEYRIRWGSMGFCNTPAVVTLHGVSLGTFPAADSSSVRGGNGTGTTGAQSSGASMIYVGLIAGAAVISQYRSNSAGTICQWEQRWLEVIPTRVG